MKDSRRNRRLMAAQAQQADKTSAHVSKYEAKRRAQRMVETTEEIITTRQAQKELRD